jgi:hypothetical protein
MICVVSLAALFFEIQVSATNLGRVDSSQFALTLPVSSRRVGADPGDVVGCFSLSNGDLDPPSCCSAPGLFPHYRRAGVAVTAIV